MEVSDRRSSVRFETRTVRKQQRQDNVRFHRDHLLAEGNFFGGGLLFAHGVGFILIYWKFGLLSRSLLMINSSILFL